jgi:hypothetical protein
MAHLIFKVRQNVPDDGTLKWHGYGCEHRVCSENVSNTA